MANENPYNPPGAEVADIAGGTFVKHQVRRLSPHQNAKVSAVMFAVTSLIFLVPFGLFAAAFAPDGATGAGMGVGFLIFAPLIYLVVGYVMTVIACAIYNLIVKFTGGIEYESQVGDT
ncbi:hypothetical protein [Piscinibacter sp. HJYY11]|uniref:hypothetical protein n=1 Tax=Piscinibacter sp. HJYY11 TaxID=2801333 RepID=UPI00191E39BA|nr:hypothetical protein [Piscinibacter sp. HJYY11]MBL0729326.1 hypothetical protein [Piscinibacter sp. HJYY11]